MFLPLPWRLRRRILTRIGFAFASEDSFIEGWVQAKRPKVKLGANVYINSGLLIDGQGLVEIGNNVRIGPRVSIITGDHDITSDPAARASHNVSYYPCRIGNGVWIGAGAVVLPKADIADGCVVGAGAVVTKSTDPNGLYLGIPARRVRDL